MVIADSLKNADRNQDAMGYYERALALDATSVKARAMSDSMMNRIITDVVFSTRDQKREELISKRIEAGLQSFKSGLFNDAISQYQLALEIDPGNKRVTDLLESTRTARDTEIANRRRSARAFRDTADFPNAIVEWNKILVLEPSDIEAKSGIDIAKSQLKANALIASAVDAMNNAKYSDAVSYLQQAQNIRPKDNSIKSMLAAARAKSAPATNLEDIKRSPDHWAIYIKGLESYQAGDYKTAIASWESLRQSFPNNPDLEKNIGQARQRLSTEGGKSQE
jgi:tetratricopeptide (TPR) repeat protein